MMAADDHFILLEFLLKAVPQSGPPFALDSSSHNLDDGDIVMFSCLSLFPPTFCRGAREACHAAELFGQLLGKPLERLRGKSPPLIVIERQQDLYKVHDGSSVFLTIGNPGSLPLQKMRKLLLHGLRMKIKKYVRL